MATISKALAMPALCVLLAGCTLTRRWDDLAGGEPDGGAGGAGPAVFGGAVRFTTACAAAVDDLSAPVDFGAGEAFTVELWYQADRFEQFNLPIHKGGSSLNYPGWDIEVNAGGNLGFFATDGTTGTAALGTEPLLAGHRYHMAVTRDGPMADVWLLDETTGETAHHSLASAVDVPLSWNSTNQLVIGGSSTEGLDCVDYTFADGIIDEVRIWNVRRSPNELDGDYASPIACEAPNLVAYYRFDEMDGALIDDCATSNIDLEIRTGVAPTDFAWVDSPFGR
jgi:hypothetical protein